MGVFQRFASARNGNVAMMFGLLLVPLIAGAGIAIDKLRADNVRAILLEAADAGILAAARAQLADPTITTAEARDITLSLFNDNLKQVSRFGFSVDDFNFDIDEPTDTYSLSVNGTMKTVLMNVLGYEVMPVSVNSKVVVNPAGPVEVALVLDNTGSMQGAKLDSLKSASETLIETLIQENSDAFRVGLVPFAQYVNVGTEHEDAFWVDVPDLNPGDVWNGCVGSRNFPRNIDDGQFGNDPVPALLNTPCPQQVFPLTSDKDEILPRIAAMTAQGATYIPGGLTWGRRLLTPQEPFTEGLTDVELERKNGIRVVVLLTDGANTRAPSFPLHNSTNGNAADAITVSLCNDIEADKIRIYAIAFEVDDPATEALMRNCATADGGYFDAASPELLESAFTAIATDLTNLALSQ